MFWDQVGRRTWGECWPWTGKRDRNGYGRAPTSRGLTSLAHRQAFYRQWGWWPKEVSHLCHDPLCCNPLHLIDESHAENIQRSARAGRYERGELRYNAKLTNEQVRIIRDRMKNGEGPTALAREYGVSQSLLSHIKRGAQRKHDT